MTENHFDSPSSKKRQSLHPILLALVLIAGIIIGFILNDTSNKKPSITQKYEYNKLQDVLQYIHNNYVDSLDIASLEDKAIEELLTDLDPHSVYIPASEIQAVQEDMQGNFEGIGVQFRIRKDTINVEATIQDGPSEKVGILAGDKIIYVEDSLIAGVGITNSDVLKLLKGPKGTKVKVSMLRGDEIIPFYIVRDKIPIYSVDVAYMIDDKTGYLKVNRFAATTYDEFTKGLETLTEQGAEQLILDLRGNPGGYLQAAVQMVDELLAGKKLVVYTEGEYQQRVDYVTHKKGLFEEGKLVILIDQFAASASEIMAGAVQDWDRGTIIGRRTFGKGLVQEQHAFPDTTALRLTVARYYTPSGRSIQKPYDDKDHYFEELDERYANGELLNADSINENGQDTLVYYTKVKNRKVFGGGGIAPDIFVPIDTSFANTYVVIIRQYIPTFLQEYATKNKTALEKYNDKNFATAFKVSDKMYNDYINHAKKQGYEGAISTDAAYVYGIKLLLKANLAKRLFRNEGFYRVVNQQALIIEKAMEALKE